MLTYKTRLSKLKIYSYGKKRFEVVKAKIFLKCITYEFETKRVNIYLYTYTIHYDFFEYDTINTHLNPKSYTCGSFNFFM